MARWRPTIVTKFAPCVLKELGATVKVMLPLFQWQLQCHCHYSLDGRTRLAADPTRICRTIPDGAIRNALARVARENIA